MDVIVNLLRRNRVKEAIDLQADAVILATMNGLDVEDVMRMPINDVVALSSSPQVPYVPQVEGYDKVWYGTGAFEHSG